MLEGEFAKSARRIRTENRDMPEQGWEKVGENGGKLWELTRGGRWRQRIVDVRIAADGKSLWVRCAEPTEPPSSTPQ